MSPERDAGAIALAERMLALLDQGAFTATYKYAVLLGLLDLCLENTARTGAPPTSVTTRQLAGKVVELYWPHVVPHPIGAVLRQTTNRRASIVTDIEAFRAAVEARTRHPLPLLGRARTVDPAGYERCVARVEWTLIRYPLLLLQKVGGEEVRFLYEVGWDASVSEAAVQRSQRGEVSSFANAILLKPRVGEYLVQLNGLLRPLIHRQWAAKVARLNDLEEAKLEEFLFGAKRVALTAVRGPLLALQAGRCFYCGHAVSGTPEVDHFLPWSRYPDNALDNLVVADRACNNDKRDFLAASAHVQAWVRRSRDGDGFAQLAAELDWEYRPERSVSVARAIYLRLPADVRLWSAIGQFVRADPRAVASALAAAA
ncbi:MAG: hypothetical protein K8W52_05225 [Deltaproteobacteria bacterium]|nr:hypothetical protein [Deltaproteobacteria bacterium]